MWNEYKYENFSPSFLTKHHDLVLYNIYNHVKTFLLFPPRCSCDDSCQCTEWREKSILALNTHRYNELYQMAEDSDRLLAMKTLLNIPDDSSFRALHPHSYPVWVIDKDLKNREEQGHFKMINQLVWTFLRLGETYKACWDAPNASVNEATKIILGDLPINTKVGESKKTKPLGGEKEYEKQFKYYQYVCHFIAAFDMWKEEISKGKRVMGSPSLEEIERFIKMTHWFRKKLLSLTRRNVKDNIFLSEEDLCPLPSWVQSDDIDFPIKPFEERVREAWAKAVLIDPKTKIATPCPLEYPGS